jgi:hypothetical protein
MNTMEVIKAVGEELGSAEFADRTTEALKQGLIETELRSRTEKMLEKYRDLRSAQRDLNKINHPDQVSYDETGAKVAETYSKARLGEIAKAEKAIAKMVGALDKAMKGDMSGFGGRPDDV